MKLTEETIKEGADRNILVYDADAKPGDLTARLISLMSVISRRNGNLLLSKIYVGSDVNMYDIKKDWDLEDGPLFVYGIEPVVDNRLDKDGSLTKFFLENGSVQCQDTNLVVGVGVNLGNEDDEVVHVLLGSC